MTRLHVATLAALGLLVCAGVVAQGTPKRSGFESMSPSLQAMQRDDVQNPGMLWVADGEALWRVAPGSGRSCADCHGDLPRAMAGVAARYPGWDATARRPVNLAQRINACRSRHQGAAAWANESKELLSLEAAVAHASRGAVLAPSPVPELAAARAEGERLYRQRMGQLHLACVQCHDELPGRRLGGTPIPQGHVNGYPIYRLEWQGLGSLRRRIRNCQIGVRAEPFAHDAPEMIALELYLAQRSAGLAVETPAVRP
ncbi:MAG: sulfur oxidation c-type cytochrome SoxA [Burkholderiaceae bacterium]|nr:sulfur oxidation c-type cytochrome SoxA [Burkholderiaceae bacterium]